MLILYLFFFNDTATTEIYTLSLHDALPIWTGRGHHQHANPMKELALQRGTPVFQPEKVNTPEALERLRALRPDVCVVAAYGQILSADLIGIPRHGAINLHASLLPKYRGAAPIQYAVWKG